MRELRERLLASLQKHAPELQAGGPSPGAGAGGAGPLATALKQRRERRQRAEAQQAQRAERDASPSWRLPAVHASDASPPATASGAYRLTDELSGLGGSAWPAAAASPAVGSSSKFRLTTDDGSGGLGAASEWRRLTDLGGSGFSGLGLGFDAGATSPGSLARLGSLDAGGSLAQLAAGAAGGSFSLGAFEAETHALARRLERL